MTITETRAKPAKAKAVPLRTFSLEVDRDEFIDALGLVGRAIDHNMTIPVLGHVKLRMHRNSLFLIGTDLDVRAASHIRCREFGRDGEFTLPFRGLAKAISQFPRGVMLIEVHPKDLKVRVSSPPHGGGKAEFVLTYDTLDPNDFPSVADWKLPTTYTVFADDLRRIINNVDFAISDDPSRYYLGGAFFEMNESKVLRMVATDGHRLVIDEISRTTRNGPGESIIVPRRTLRVVEQYCKAQPGTFVEVASGLDGIRFAFNHGLSNVVWSKRIDGVFPDYKRVMPQDNDKLAAFDNNTLYKALDRFPAARGRGEGKVVKLTLKKNVVTLSREAIDGNPAVTQPVACEYDGPSLEIGFNAAYLRDALSVLDNTVGIAFNDASTPILMMSAEFPQVVVMPARV